MGSSIFSHYPLRLRYGFFVGLVLITWGPLYFTSSQSVPTSTPLKNVVVTHVDGRALEPPRPSTLPLRFFDTHRDNTSITLQLELNAVSEWDEIYALYIPWLTGSLRVRLNGAALSQDWHGPDPPVQSRYPLLYQIHPKLLEDIPAVLTMELDGEFPGEGRLEPVYFSTLDDLKPRWQMMYFHKVTIVHVLSVLLILLVLFAMATFLFIERKSLYPWFAAVGLSWLVSNELYLFVSFPIDPMTRRILFALSTLLTIITLPIFVRRYIGLGQTSVERFYLAYALVECIAVTYFVALGSIGVTERVETYIRIRSLLCIVYSTALYYWYLKNLKEPAPLIALWLVSLALAAVSFPLYSLMSYMFDTSFLPTNYFLTGSIHLILAFTTIYVAEMHRLFDGLITLNSQLDKKVSEASKEIEQRYQQIQEFTEKQAVAQERERIMQDIHDGVAAHLVTAMAIANRNDSTHPRIVELMRTSITDLRLVIDSLVSTEAQMDELLHNFEVRIRPILKEAKIELHWDVQDAGRVALGSEELLNLYRCLQEGCTNVIRHASASKIHVRSRIEPEAFVLSIHDDGVGLPEQIIEGRGLSNIKRRMKKMGGSASITASDTYAGAMVELKIPLI